LGLQSLNACWSPANRNATKRDACLSQKAISVTIS
jgi:hypothetical protein